MQGILLVDKPIGWTSFDVVAKIRGVVNAQAKQQGMPRVKVGHAGTLDPLATGLLIIAIGKATKQIDHLIKHDKSYEVTMTLGARSTTDDQEGELEQVTVVHAPKEQRVIEVVRSFVGIHPQVPPAFSAIKVGGVKSYHAARKGKLLDLKPRNVTIYSISDIKYAFPSLSFATRVGSGTYIRSLARDIGEMLGTGGYVCELRRVSIDRYDVSNAISPVEVTYDYIHEHLLYLS